MAYLPGFSADVFVSYSHIDDEPFGENDSRWVTEFHRNLEVRVRTYLGRPVTIWRDPKLTGSDIFSDEIVTQLKRTALLISVVSPGYVHSEWCSRELQTFVQQLQTGGGVSVENKNRVVKVIKTPVSRKEIPEILDSVLGYEFYRVEWGSEIVREFLLDPSPEARRAYWARLDDVAQAIKRLFEAIAQGSQASSAPSADSAQTIFLAATTSDLEDQRDLLRRELEDRGHIILPDKPFPMNAQKLAEAVRTDLARASVSIHLLGERYGIVPEGETRSIVQLQHDLAAQRDPAGFLRITWIPPGLKPAEEREKQFIETVRANPGQSGRSELLETSVEELKTFILDRLKKPAHEAPAAKPAQSSDGDGPTQIYLICDPQDRPAIAALRKHLHDSGFEVVLPLSKGEPDQVREDHQENLRLCDAVIIYWGGADEFWLRSKLRDLARVRGLGRTAPFRASAIYIADPASDEKQDFETREAKLIRQLGPFSPDALDPFVAQMKGAAHG
ncbi:MAG: TIR domain-containing protein [Candidatus Binataceae bacterium]